MSKMIFDWDPSTGVTTYFDFDQSKQEAVLTYEQDVEPALRKAEAFRQYPERSAKGVRKDMLHYAIIPVAIQYRMLIEDGVNYWDPKQDARIFRLINDKYSRFKCTELTHNIKNGT